MLIAMHRNQHTIDGDFDASMSKREFIYLDFFSDWTKITNWWVLFDVDVQLLIIKQVFDQCSYFTSNYQIDAGLGNCHNSANYRMVPVQMILFLLWSYTDNVADYNHDNGANDDNVADDVAYASLADIDAHHIERNNVRRMWMRYSYSSLYTFKMLDIWRFVIIEVRDQCTIHIPNSSVSIFVSISVSIFVSIIIIII